MALCVRLRERKPEGSRPTREQRRRPLPPGGALLQVGAAVPSCAAVGQVSQRVARPSGAAHSGVSVGRFFKKLFEVSFCREKSPSFCEAARVHSEVTREAPVTLVTCSWSFAAPRLSEEKRWRTPRTVTSRSTPSFPGRSSARGERTDSEGGSLAERSPATGHCGAA